MKEKFLLLSICIAFQLFCFSQIEPKQAELNPDFVRYMEQKKSGKLKRTTIDGYYFGCIPSPVIHNFDNLKVLKKTTSLPAYYDLRIENGGNWLTSVKDQGQCGSCWTFATMGAIESYCLKQGLSVYDLSEQNLATCHGFEWEPCEGGQSDMVTAYFSRGSGPIAESEIPYTLPANTSCVIGTPVSTISEARFLPGIESGAFDASIVKQALVDYGAIYVNMLWNWESYNDDDDTYFYNANYSSEGHAVLLVGWDDNKVVTGGVGVTPESPGAWIIRNSWSPNFGEDGYFYISYEDTKALRSIAYYPSFNYYDASAEINCIDKLGQVSTFGWSSGSSFGLIKKTASQNQEIERIGTYAYAANTVIEIDIFADFDGNNLSNPLGSLTGQVCDYPGYYTFNLPSPVEVSAGSDFYIRIKYNTGVDYQIPFEKYYEGYADPVIEKGKCWVSSNGLSNNWFALGQDTDYKWDLCIKTYAVPINDPCTPPTIQASNFNVDAIGNTNVTISWTRGDGNAVIVLAKEESVVDQDPYNGVFYSANENFAFGDEIGDGNYVLYNGSGTSVNVTGLSGGHEYYFAVYEYNTSETCYLTSGLVGSVNTPCEAISSFPYSQDFSTLDLPNCWENIDNESLGQVWQFNNPGGRIFNATTAANGFAILDSDKYGSGGSQNTDLITPTFDFSNYDVVELNFEHYYRDYSNQSATLAYSIDNGNTWTAIQSWSDLSTGNAETYSQDLSVEVAGQSNVKFKWNYIGSWGYYWAIDDIEINASNSPPHDLAVADITPVFLPLGESIVPTVTIDNLGTNSEDAYSVNLTDGSGYDETINVATILASKSNTTIDMPVWNPIAGSYTLTATVTLTGDKNSANDEAYQVCNVVEMKGHAYGIVVYSPGSTPYGLCAFNLTTPTIVYPIAEYKRTDKTFAGTWANGKWYGADQGNNLFVVDPISGETTTIGTGSQAFNGLGYCFTSNTMYGVTGTDLYTVNLTDGSATHVGNMGTGLAIGLAVNSTGDLYTVDIENDSLYRINKETGIATAIGSIGFNAQYAEDLEFDNNTDILYFTAVNVDNGDAGELRTINVNTGASTLVGTIGDGIGCEVTGFAIPNTPIKISVSANPSSGGEVSGGGTYSSGDSVTVTATANPGYTFINWTEDDSLVSTSASYDFIVTRDRNLLANFNLNCQPDWTVMNYTNSTTAYGKVFIGDNNTPAVVGDLVGAFVNGECRGIGTCIINEGIAYVTIVIQGETVEDVEFKVWDQSECLEFNNGRAQTNPGGNIGYPPDYLEICGGCSVQQDIHFNSGWNLFSLFAHPDDMTSNSIFSSMSNLKQVKNMSQSYDPVLPSHLNTLVTLNDGEAYFANVSANEILSVVGPLVDPNTSISLSSGWNLIGYPFESSSSTSDAFASLVNTNNLVQVKNMSQSFDPSLPAHLNTLTTLEPGEGYLINLNNGVGFIYPEVLSVSFKSVSIENAETPWVTKNYTKSMVHYGLVTIDGFSVENDAVIGAFVNTECRGQGIIQSDIGETYTTLVINGEEEEIVSFKLFENGKIYSSDNLVVNIPGKITQEVISIEFNTESATNIHSQVSETNLTIVPNPARDNLKINYHLNSSSQVEITIADILGRTIYKYLKVKEAGAHILELQNLKGSYNMSKGTYILQFSQNGNVSSYKIIIQ